MLMLAFHDDAVVSNTHQQNIFYPIISQQNNSSKGFLETAIFTEKICENIQNYSVIMSKSLYLQEICEFYELLLHKIMNQESDIHEKFNEFQNAQKEFLEQPKLSISSLIFYEILRLINVWNYGILTDNNKKFLQIIGANQYTKNHLYQKENFLQEYLPTVINPDLNIHNLLLKNTENFSYLAQQCGAEFYYQEQLQNGKTLAYTDHLPVSLKPMILKKQDFDSLCSKQLLWNQLIINITNDKEWLNELFTSKTDDFTVRHLKLFQKILLNPSSNQTNFAINRNDFMYDVVDQKWQQIELNIMATGGSHFSQTVQELHLVLKNSYYKKLLKDFEMITFKTETIVSDGLEQAFKLYNKPDAIVLMIVAEFEAFYYDQKFIEFNLLKRGIMLQRKTFKQLIQELNYDSESSEIYIDGQEIAVVYFRNGYTPDHFFSEEVWETREKLELSRAIKCPNITLTLINSKLVQMKLKDKKILRKYLESEEQVEIIAENFTQFYDLEDDENQENILEIMKNNPYDYVMKPQREGGSNNIYGRDIYKLLSELRPDERKNYIIMKKIKSSPSVGFTMRKQQYQTQSLIPELGFYSYFLSENNNILKNVQKGYICRSKVINFLNNQIKRFNDNEGSINSGNGFVDSVMYRKE